MAYVQIRAGGVGGVLGGREVRRGTSWFLYRDVEHWNSGYGFMRQRYNQAKACKLSGKSFLLSGGGIVGVLVGCRNQRKGRGRGRMSMPICAFRPCLL